jgi:hypothetical protein
MGAWAPGSLLGVEVSVLGLQLPILVAGVALGIGTLAGLQAWGMQRKYHQGTRALHWLGQTLETLAAPLPPGKPLPAEALETMEEALAPHPFWQGAWPGFRRSLHLRLSAPSAVRGGEACWLATRASEAWFDAHAVAAMAGIDRGWQQALPGLLTGLGLLGTFLALLVGLSSVHVSPTGQVAGIQDLINSLSGKFLTSVVGLVSGIAVMLLDRWGMSQLKTASRPVLAHLATLFPVVSAEGLWLKLSDDIQTQTVTLRQFFTTDLSNTLAAGLQESLSPQMGRLVEAIAQLETTTQALRREKRENVSSSLEPMLAEFQASMTAMAAHMRTSMTEGASQEIRALSETLSQVVTGVEAMQAGLSQTVAQVSGMQQQHSSQLAQTARLQADEMAAMAQHFAPFGQAVQTLSASAQHIHQALQQMQTLHTRQDQMLHVQDRALEQAHGVQSDLSESLKLVKEGLQQQRQLYQGIDQQLARLLTQLTEAFERYHAAVAGSMREHQTQFEDHLVRATSLLGQTVEGLQAHLEDLDDVLSAASASAALAEPGRQRVKA